jgi:hypothetical protein
MPRVEEHQPAVLDVKGLAPYAGTTADSDPKMGGRVRRRKELESILDIGAANRDCR